MKVVYITGCLGFIGSYITRLCLQKGWYVKGVDKITYAANQELLNEFREFKNFSFINDDINDLKFIYYCDYIINTAAETHVGNSISNSDEFIRTNVNGVHNLLNLIKNYRLETSVTPTLLHLSTDEVYGDVKNLPHNETATLQPSNPYSATKAAADMLIIAWARTFNVPYVIVRPTNNYGIGQYVEKLIPKTIKYLNLGRRIPLHNNGKPIRNWLHVEDTAKAILHLTELGVKNEIFNISGGFEQSNYETLKKIILNYNGDNDIEKYIDFSYTRPGIDIHYSLDDSKIRNSGWRPEKVFDHEIKGIVKHYKDNFIW